MLQTFHKGWQKQMIRIDRYSAMFSKKSLLIHTLNILFRIYSCSLPGHHSNSH